MKKSRRFYFLIFKEWFKFWIKNSTKNEEKYFFFLLSHSFDTPAKRAQKHLPSNQSTFIACLPACLCFSYYLFKCAISYTWRAISWVTSLDVSSHQMLNTIIQLFSAINIIIVIMMACTYAAINKKKWEEMQSAIHIFSNFMIYYCCLFLRVNIN